jgi:serine/threonine protein phosphatase PrpC
MDVTAHSAPETPRSSKRRPPPFTFHAAGRTDRGLVREINEDQLLVAPPAASPAAGPASRPVEMQLLVVADGMGGHEGGEHASRIAVRTVGSTLLPALERLPAACATDDELEEAFLAEMTATIERAHDDVREEAARRPELADMGTTLTVAYRHGTRLFVAHAGDSRCYLFRAGALTRITRDHTLVDELMRFGYLKSEREASFAVRGILTNAVGSAAEPVKVDTHLVHLRPGDAVLLCTDGLTGLVSDAAIASALEAYTDPQECVDHLVDAAIDAGGHDNITAVVARCE